MGVLDILVIPFILFIGHRLIGLIVSKYAIPNQRKLLLWLFYYHLAFGILFGIYVSLFGGDAVGYWRDVAAYNVSDFNVFEFHKPGTHFIRFLVYPFVHIFNLSFWSGCLIFSMFGFFGFVAIYLTILKTTTINPSLFGFKLFPLVLFLPNMHFWSAGIGKDTIMFFALALFIFSLTNPIRNIPGFILSFYLAFFIRPHIALLMVVGFGFSMVSSVKGLAVFWRIAFFAGAIALFVAISPAVFEFIKLDENEIEQLDDLAQIRAKNLSRAKVGSSIDISSYPMPLKILTFLFRPLFFDAPNVFGFIVSIENLFYVILGLTLFRWRSLPGLLTLPTHLKAALFVLGSAAFFMSSSLSNLGIIIRQKNMVMFMFVLITFYLLSKAQEKSQFRMPSFRIGKKRPGLKQPVKPS